MVPASKKSLDVFFFSHKRFAMRLESFRTYFNLHQNESKKAFCVNFETYTNYPIKIDKRNCNFHWANTLRNDSQPDSYWAFAKRPFNHSEHMLQICFIANQFNWIGLCVKRSVDVPNPWLNRKLNFLTVFCFFFIKKGKIIQTRKWYIANISLKIFSCIVHMEMV